MLLHNFINDMIQINTELKTFILIIVWAKYVLYISQQMLKNQLGRLKGFKILKCHFFVFIKINDPHELIIVIPVKNVH